MLPQASADHYRRQQRITATTVALVRRAWSQMGDGFDASWSTVRPAVLRAIVAGQLAAARDSDRYLAEFLAELGEPNDPAGTLNAAAFAGVNPSGVPLESATAGGVVKAKQAVGRGASSAQALEAGGRWLDLMTTTTIADTSRQATSAAMTARSNVSGYVRMLNPPSCSRCAILAGSVYRWNDGFLRHPGCDCRHIPKVESLPDATTDPRRYFDSLSPADQNRIFTNVGAEAIRDGADIGQVVNARTGMYSTAEGITATRQGARRFTEGRTRLMPESIYEITNDRTEAIALLRENGFIR